MNQEEVHIKDEPYFNDRETSEEEGRITIKDNILVTKEGNREIHQQLYIKEEDLSSNEDNNDHDGEVFVEDNDLHTDNHADLINGNSTEGGFGSTELGVNVPLEVYIKEEHDLMLPEDQGPVNVTNTDVSHSKEETRKRVHSNSSSMEGGELKRGRGRPRKCYIEEVASSTPIDYQITGSAGEPKGIKKEREGGELKKGRGRPRKCYIEEAASSSFIDCQITGSAGEPKGINKESNYEEMQGLQVASNNSNSEETKDQVIRNWLNNSTQILDTEDMLEEEVDCIQCNYKTSSLKKLAYHVKYVCSKRVLQNCFYCDFQTKYEVSMRNHIIKKHNFGEDVIACPYCRFMTLSFMEIQDHITIKHRKPTKYYYCLQCEFKCMSKIGVEYHTAVKHTFQKNVACSLCEYKCFSAAIWRRHMLVKHNKVVPYKKRKSKFPKY